MTDKTPRAWDGALEQEFYTPEEIAASDARVGKAHRMLYREKVIEGLKFTLEESGWDANAAYDQELMIQAVADAIALLKAQEPRVMTLEEVETIPYGYVLIETDKQDKLRWLDALLFSKNANFSFDFITLEGRVRLLGTEYNREWRCWTSRPTDEQREATPWE